MCRGVRGTSSAAQDWQPRQALAWGRSAGGSSPVKPLFRVSESLLPTCAALLQGLILTLICASTAPSLLLGEPE